MKTNLFKKTGGMNESPLSVFRDSSVSKKHKSGLSLENPHLKAAEWGMRLQAQPWEDRQARPLSLSGSQSCLLDFQGKSNWHLREDTQGYPYSGLHACLPRCGGFSLNTASTALLAVSRPWHKALCVCQLDVNPTAHSRVTWVNAFPTLL